MSDEPTDDRMIERMRAALDEVATGSDTDGGSDGLIPVRPSSPAPRRWLAIAAATVLLVGGAAFALSRRSSDGPVAAPTSTPAPTGPATTPLATTTTTTVAAPTTTLPPPQPATPWFNLDYPDVTLGAITHRDPLPVEQQDLTQWWMVGSGESRGFLTVRIAQGLTPGVEGDYTVEDLDLGSGVAYFLRPNLDGAPMDYGFELRWFRDDGSAWLFQSQGLSRDRLVAAVTMVVPGSGLPIVIADPTFTMMSVGTYLGEAIEQGDATNSGSIQVSVERDGLPFSNLISAANIIDVTVAGTPGYAGQLTNNAIVVTWDAGNGWWGHLWIGSQLARGADGIIASVTLAQLPGE